MSSRLDVWEPQEKEQWGETLDSLIPTRSPESIARRAEILIRKAKDLRTRKLFIERRATKREVGEGQCQFCLQSTPRDFCSETCEKDAAMAVLPIKFHEES